MSTNATEIPDTIEPTIKLRKCWVRDCAPNGWDKRWNILGTNKCICNIQHDKVPDIENIDYAMSWNEIRFDDPNAPKQMTHAEIEAALGYKIKIKE